MFFCILLYIVTYNWIVLFFHSFIRNPIRFMSKMSYFVMFVADSEVSVWQWSKNKTRLKPIECQNSTINPLKHCIERESAIWTTIYMLSFILYAYMDGYIYEQICFNFSFFRAFISNHHETIYFISPAATRIENLNEYKQCFYVLLFFFYISYIHSLLEQQH